MPTGTIPSGYGPNAAVIDEISFVTIEGDQFTFPPGGAGMPFASVREGSFDAATGTPIMVTGAHGKVTVEVKMGRDLEAKKSPGRHKERLIDRGLKKAEIRVVLTSWTQDAHDQIETIIKILELRQRRSKRTAIQVFHPYLQALGIDRVVEKEVSVKNGELHGSVEMHIDFFEWQPERPRQPSRTIVATSFPVGTFDPFGGSVVNSRNASAFNFVPNLGPNR